MIPTGPMFAVPLGQALIENPVVLIAVATVGLGGFVLVIVGLSELLDRSYIAARIAQLDRRAARHAALHATGYIDTGDGLELSAERGNRP